MIYTIGIRMHILNTVFVLLRKRNVLKKSYLQFNYSTTYELYAFKVMYILSSLTTHTGLCFEMVDWNCKNNIFKQLSNMWAGTKVTYGLWFCQTILTTGPSGLQSEMPLWAKVFKFLVLIHSSCCSPFITAALDCINDAMQRQSMILWALEVLF